MPEYRRHHKKRGAANSIAQITIDGLVTSITILLSLIFVLIFKLVDSLWPAGVIDYRNQIAGVLAFIVFMLILMSPIIVEFNTHPRPLKGPGKYPGGGWDP